MSEKKLILAIDDDPVSLNTLVGLLKDDYKVSTSISAANAIIMMEQVLPDLILLDVGMPEVSGFEFLQKIKKIPKFRNIPVVIVTGHYETEFIIHAENSGASSVACKPVDREDLFRKINAALERPKKNIVKP